jgi:hypothetical protein
LGREANEEERDADEAEEDAQFEAIYAEWRDKHEAEQRARFEAVLCNELWQALELSFWDQEELQEKVHTENNQQRQEKITKAEFSVHEAQPQMSSNKGLEASLEGMKDESPPGMEAAAAAFAPANQGEAGVAADVAADAASAVVAGGGAAGIEMKAAVGAAGAEASSDKEERAAEPSTQKASVGHADSAAPPETLAESAVRATAPLTAAEPSTQKASVGHADGAATPETLAESAVRATAPLTAEGMNAMLQSFFKDFRTELRADQAGSRAEQAGFEKRVESLFVKASEQTATLDTK